MDDKLNICLLNESFPPVIDGVANCVLNYAENIQKNSGNAIVAVPHYPGVTDDYPYRVVRYPSINTTKSIGYRTGIPYWPATLRELMKSDIDLIHTHCPFVSTMFARALRSAVNAPIVLTYHTKYDIDIKNAVELGFIQAAAIKFIVSNIEACDEVWVVSEGAGENLKSLGYTGGYRVMENGVDLPRGQAAPEEIAEICAEYGLEDGVPTFLYVGRMMWYKNIRLTLDGLFRAKLRGARFRMVFVGSGADFEEIKICANALGLTKECVFTGIVKDRKKLRAFFSRADMFLFPSTFDTNGIVVREAAACGLASVLVRGSCAAEGITDGRHGILIDENADALADAVLRVAHDQAAARVMGKTAMEEIYLSWEDAVGRATARYPQVIKDYKSSQPEHGDFQAGKLFKLADDIELGLTKLKVYRNKHRSSGVHKRLRIK
ncbi:Glycosyltransferase involved in cell wall bisynthesis [Sporobacter termitidis DSM 10068]|uniref:Glycosyltransferase involved in cell wall bisynthesis n=1 Tax=Sporobacter termitidis DSM 10068 TaxID=1123282 RepID=A0A1M5YFQ1_9FIRM|nr:glycosyltransferase [Sporobacter termitidis]SHI10729.1 Glycosyltransferase involved in cell wall bisynthesis [Sporobacter termitidis DSM 10068]